MNLRQDHLDDEAISAALDGEATAEERSHLASCERCSARLSRFAEVAALVGAAPPPPAEAELDLQRTAALAAVAPSPGPTRAVVTPIAPRLERRRATRGLPSWLGVAAAIGALLLAIPVLVALLAAGGGDDEDETAALSAESFEERSSSSESESAQTPDADAAVAVVEAGDLGELATAEDLRQAIDAALPRPSAGSAAGDAAGDPRGEDEDDAEGESAADSSESEAEEASEAEAESESESSGGEAAAEPAASPTTTTTPGEPSAAAAFGCAEVPASEFGPLGALRLSATAVVDGVEAELYAYDDPAEPGSVSVFALASGSCRLLRFASLAGR